MRKTMIMVSAIMMSLTASAENKMSVAPFEGVSVSVPARVRFVYGDEYAMDVQATDSLVASAIRWTVKDGVLRIRSIDGGGEMENVCITIVSPKAPSMTVGRNMEMRETERVYDNAQAES